MTPAAYRTSSVLDGGCMVDVRKGLPYKMYNLAMRIMGTTSKYSMWYVEILPLYSIIYNLFCYSNFTYFIQVKTISLLEYKTFLMSRGMHFSHCHCNQNPVQNQVTDHQPLGKLIVGVSNLISPGHRRAANRLLLIIMAH